MAKRSGVDTVLLIGGEPLLHPELNSIIALVHEMGMRVVVVTNGLALYDSSFAGNVLQSLAEEDELGISIKGFDDRQYYVNCGINSGFEKLALAISNIEEACVNYSLSFVIAASNLDDLTAGLSSIVHRFGKPIGLSFCSPCFSGGKVSEHASPEEQASLISCALSSLPTAGYGMISVHINTPLCLFDKALIDAALDSATLITGCHVLNQSGIVFDTNGNSLLCNHLAGLPIGIMDHDYSNPIEFQAFLSGTKQIEAWSAFTRLPYNQCSSCKELPSCGGGCPLFFY